MFPYPSSIFATFITTIVYHLRQSCCSSPPTWELSMDKPLVDIGKFKVLYFQCDQKKIAKC